MADDDLDDDFDLDEDDMPSGESGVPAPTGMDDDDDFDFDDEFDEDGGSRGSGKLASFFESNKKVIVISISLIFGLMTIIGSYWYLFMGDEGQGGGSLGNAVGMALEKEQTKAGFTPQQKLVTGAAAGKLAMPDKMIEKGHKLGAGDAAGKLSAGASMAAANIPGGMGGYDPDNKETPLSTAAVADVGISIPAVLPQAVADFGAPQAAEPLALPNDPGLFEQTESGMLPVISPDGKESWKTYARPFGGDGATPTVGLVVTGLGMSSALSEAAINHLPTDVTLAFSAYGSGINGWVEKARAMGHEVVLELPMEAESFPVDDPGPLSMMTSKEAAENLKTLNSLMASAQGYVGFVAQYGSKFLRDKKAMTPVLGELKTRGLLFVDPRTAGGSLTIEVADQMQLPRALIDTTLMSNVSSAQIRAQLETLSTIAGTRGLSVGMIKATPNAIKAIKDWAAKLQKAKIAPISSLAGRQQS